MPRFFKPWGLVLLSLALSFAAHAQPVTQLPAANLPLSGAETIYLVQQGVSKQTPSSSIVSTGSFANITAGSLTVTGGSNLAGPVAIGGKLTTAASTTIGAGFNLPPGTAPTLPQNGDMWSTSSGFYGQAGGMTIGPFAVGGGAGTPTCSVNNMLWYANAGSSSTCLTTINNGVLSSNSSAVPSFSATLPPNLVMPGESLTARNYTISTLPGVTSGNQGLILWASDCRNGSEGSGVGTGCFYGVNNAGTWTPVPFIPTQQIAIGPQAAYLGGSFAVQGNGGSILLFAGSTHVAGNAIVFDSNGNGTDGGVPPGGGGGGGGTVTSCPVNTVPYYPATGTTINCITIANSAVLVTSSSGVPSESSTLPANLTIPTPAISSPTLSGTTSAAAIVTTGKITTAATTALQAGLNLPEGTTPTSPVNGDVWIQSGIGLEYRQGGVTKIPATSIVGTSPIASSGAGAVTITCITCATTTAGGPLSGTTPIAISSSGVISCATCAFTTSGGLLNATTPVSISAAGLIACATCATTTNGGALTATAPITVSAGGIIALGSQPFVIPINFDSTTVVHNDTYYVPLKWIWATGKITDLNFFTSGTSTPSFHISVNINGTPITNCTGLTVTASMTPSSPGVATCSTSNNSITVGQNLALVISNIAGSPSSAYIGIDATRSAN